MLMLVAATLQHAWEFQKWHQKMSLREMREINFLRPRASPRRTIGLPTPCFLRLPRARAAGGGSRRLLQPFGQKHDGWVSFGAGKRGYNGPESIYPPQRFFLTFCLLDVP
jgi:hypothetical protein